MLYSTDGKWFVGEYIGSGQFSTITDCPLQEDGSFAQRFTHIYKHYFVAWLELEPPLFPTTAASDFDAAEEVHASVMLEEHRQREINSYTTSA